MLQAVKQYQNNWSRGRENMCKMKPEVGLVGFHFFYRRYFDGFRGQPRRSFSPASLAPHSEHTAHSTERRREATGRMMRERSGRCLRPAVVVMLAAMLCVNSVRSFVVPGATLSLPSRAHAAASASTTCSQAQVRHTCYLARGT